MELCCTVIIDSGILATIFPSGVAYSVKVKRGKRMKLGYGWEMEIL